MLRLLPALLLISACTSATVDYSAVWESAQELGGVVRLDKAQLQAFQGEDESNLPYAVDAEGNVLVSQPLVDDHGHWSALLVAAEDRNKIAAFEWVLPANYPEFDSQVQVYLGKRNEVGSYESKPRETRPADHRAQPGGSDYLYQAEGPIWENDLIGFRNYFDERNGFDIFGKTKPDFAAQEIGITGNYHELQHWGMDVLKVGSSLGAGALGISKADTLYPIGEAAVEHFQQLAYGPLMASFELQYEELENFPGITIYRTISILAGLPGYLTENHLSGGSDEQLTTGIVTLHSDNFLERQAAEFSRFATHGPQAELDKHLGMAIVTTTAADSGHSPEAAAPVTTTYFVRPQTERSLDYLFLAGWELQDASYTDESVFLEKVDHWAAQYAAWTNH
ncbi:MAG: DUF4861 family protein [Bacteroidota bacterium]